MILALASPFPSLPAGTITPTEACRWLTERTGTEHAVAAALRDYPVFLSVHGSEPKRVEALLARALAAQWEVDGRLLRLAPTPIAKGEGGAAFAVRWRAATKSKGAIGSLPAETLAALPVGRILALGTAADPLSLPLPKESVAALRREAKGEPSVYVCRRASGRFEASLFAETDDGRRIVSPPQRIEFDDVPSSIRARLSASWNRPEFPSDAPRFDPFAATRSFDWRATDRIDPTTAFADPLLGPVAVAMGADVAIAVPDLVLSSDADWGSLTLGQTLKAIGTMVDLSLDDGALVGRLPVVERRVGTQVRRSTLAAPARSASATRTLGLADLAAFSGAQRPGATEARNDLAMLSLLGVGFGETRWADMPYSALLAAALPPEAWSRLRTNEAIRVGDLPPAVGNVLQAMLASSPERMLGNADPVRWPGFASGRVVLRARVSDRRIVNAVGADAPWGASAYDMGAYHEDWKRKLGSEPKYTWADLHTITFTVGPESGTETWRTRFADIETDRASGMVSWSRLPSDLRREFERGMNSRRKGK